MVTGFIAPRSSGRLQAVREAVGPTGEGGGQGRNKILGRQRPELNHCLFLARFESLKLITSYFHFVQSEVWPRLRAPFCWSLLGELWDVKSSPSVALFVGNRAMQRW